MKKILFILSFLGFCISAQSQSSPQMDSVLSLPLSSFIGKPVDSLLIKLPSAPTYKKIHSGGRPFHAQRLVMLYNDSTVVNIIVENFNFMDRFDQNSVWDLTLFRKESIAWILISKWNDCVYGCDGKYY
ncbi:MAG: hypothetical protein JWP88_848 [Flaviaesturariibacter sp.]|nr:hypothetical protein [Flaviaesturariibacter sp.]